MELTPILATVALIFVAELPDKTMVATLVLATRFRPIVVWLGVGSAFGIQAALAVAVGQVLALLPRTPVLAVTAGLFTVGAVVMFRSASRHAAPDELDGQIADQERELGRVTTSSRRAFWVSFGVVFAAEWGDLSQLTTASLSARFDAPVEVFIGAWGALLVVAALAVLAGGWLTKRLRLPLLERLAGTLLAVLAGLTVLEAAGLLV